MLYGVLRYFDERRTRAVVECENDKISTPFGVAQLPKEIAAALLASPFGITVQVRNIKRPLDGIQRCNLLVNLDSLGETWPITQDINADKAKEFQVTDKALALRKGHRYRKNRIFEHPGKIITDLGTTVPVPGPAGPPSKPHIDRNPYNFVALAGDQPWLENPDAATGKHQGHDRWRCELLHGSIKITMEALTPVFVPAGFPFKSEPDGSDSEEEREEVTRPFCQLRKVGEKVGETELRYAIPGSSVKGPIRAMVEAIANDRFGVANEASYKMPIPYRRRSFQLGQLETKLPGGDWEVRPMQGKVGSSGLLALTTESPVAAPTSSAGGPVIILKSRLVEKYKENIKHVHYETYVRDLVRSNPDRRRTGPPQWVAARDRFLALSEADRNKGAVDQLVNAARSHLLELEPGVQIFYTLDENGRIDSFGKNVNYLWPAEHSVYKLAEHYFPPKRRGLGWPLGLAERMFGFVSDHRKAETDEPASHPFRAKLRFETFWAEGNPTPQTLELAPLTAPRTRAKSRPLYLVGRTDLVAGDELKSASYSDSHPFLRGRKFYWRQNPGNGQVWKGHERSELHEKSQLPPPIGALPKDTEFKGCIHFENLSRVELGALLFAVTGRSQADKTNADGGATLPLHTIQLGKGKPRGLGTLEPTKIHVVFRHPEHEYQSLLAPAPPAVIDEEDLSAYRQAFESWCVQRACKPFDQIEHIADFVKLHTWPGKVSVRYYPLHFSDYGWLPEANQNPDEPKGGVQRRPRAMRPAARDVDP